MLQKHNARVDFIGGRTADYVGFCHKPTYYKTEEVGWNKSAKNLDEQFLYVKDSRFVGGLCKVSWLRGHEKFMDVYFD